MKTHHEPLVKVMATMRRTFRELVLLCGILSMVLISFSCGNGPVSAPGIPGNEYLVGMGGAAFDPAGAYRISLDTVLTDSRCPLHALCVWEGEATPRFTFLRAGADSARIVLKIRGYTMKADSANHLPLDTLGYRFTLLQLDPYPEIGITIHPRDYRATLRIVKL